MPEENKNILKYSPGDKSLKVPFIIYADLECLLKKEQSYQNNSKNCIKKFCEDLKELAIEIINYDEKEMIPFTDK